MWIHIIIILIFCVLFIVSRGFFSKTSEFLTGVFPDFLQLTKKQIHLCFIVIFIGNLLGLLVSVMTNAELNTVKDGYLVRNERGEGAYEEELIASNGKLSERIKIVVEEIPYTKDEINQMLDTAIKEMDTLILGENTSFDCIEYPLNLVTEIEETPILIQWDTNHPVYLDWEGTLGEDIPEEGVPVTLTGELSVGESIRVYEKELIVYPERLSEEDAFIRKVEKQASLYGKEEGEYQYLPEEIDGKQITWKADSSREGWLITGLSVLIGILLVFSEKSRKKEKQEAKEKEMLLDYPLILNKLILFMRAGISSRQAIRKMVLEYQKKKGTKRYAYEEMCRMYFEMEQGISEEMAYERFGSRCGLMEYKTLSTLLVQNLKKGSSQFIPALEKECRQAFEERKKRALISGEEAGTKLLIPMVMMLLIVLMIIMVPSFLAF